MRPGNGVRQSAFMAHIIVLGCCFVMAVPKDDQGAFGLGRRQTRLTGLRCGAMGRLCHAARGESGRKITFQRTGAALILDTGARST